MTDRRFPYPIRLTMMLGLAFGLVSGVTPPALAQTGDGTSQSAAGIIASEIPPRSARDVLTADIARMEADLATLARFTAWQEKLLQAYRSDPHAALAQRLPMAECRASVLAPVCDHLTGTFAPEEESSAAGNKPGPGETATTPDKGEGSQ